MKLLAALVLILASTAIAEDLMTENRPAQLAVLCEIDGKEFWTPFGADSNTVIEFDTRNIGGQTAASEPIPIIPHKPYRLSGMMKRISGHWRYNFMLVWMDEEKTDLSVEYAWVSQVVGDHWELDYIEAIAPENAKFARVVIQSEPGKAFLMKDIKLEQMPPVGAKLAIELIPDQIANPKTPFDLIIRIENRGDVKLNDVQVELNLPEGLSADEKINLSAGDLSYSQTFREVVSIKGYPQDANSLIECVITVQTDDGEVEFRQSTKPFITIAEEKEALTSELPEPNLPEMDIKLGAYYFPVMLDWDRSNWGVRKVDYLVPKLGYYDESLPEVADWHIYWALEHGISFFVFDWYYNQEMFYLNDALEKGFLQSRFADKMKFCIDWCNEGHCSEFKPIDFSHKSLEGFIRTLCERYFHRENYLRVDGKPVVIIHIATQIANAHGGWDGCALALDKMRSIAREYGHPGVYFVALQNNKPFLLDYARGGFDAVTAYAYGFRDQHLDPETRSMPFEGLIPRHNECFEIAQRDAHAQGLDYIPSAWVGWDDYARAKDSLVRTGGNTPAAFRRMMEMLPEYVDRTKLALFEAWNEWGEGSHAEPEEHYGFGRLSAIRDILSRERGPYSILTPTKEEVERFNTDITWDEVNDLYYDRYARSLELEKGFRMDFETVHDLWLRPGSGLRHTKINSGLLTAESVNNDPIMLGPPMMNLPAENFKAVKVKMRLTGGTVGQLFWSAQEKRGWSDERSVTFPIKADGIFHEYLIELEGHPEWEGVIRQFRFDPTDAPGSVAIDYFYTVGMED